MDVKKWMRLKQAGWSLGDAADFLNLSTEEAALIELRSALSRGRRRSASRPD